MRNHDKSCMCASCKSKKGLHSGKDNPNYKRGSTLNKHYCKEPECGNIITYQSWHSGNGRCRSCARRQEFVEGKRDFSDHHKQAISRSKTGSNNPKWVPTGSTYSDGTGYIKEKSYDNRWVAQQKLVVERFLNRKLSKSEVVHHIDGNRSNNSIDNLYLFSKRGLHSCFTQLVKHGILKLEMLNSNLELIKIRENGDVK